MNRSDLKIIAFIILLALVLYLGLNLMKKEGNIASIYYEDDLLITVDLNIDKEYVVSGQLGDVILEVQNGKIRVKEENSPRHLCSLQGYTNSSSKPIICLPNKIIIKVSNVSDIDGVVY